MQFSIAAITAVALAALVAQGPGTARAQTIAEAPAGTGGAGASATPIFLVSTVQPSEGEAGITDFCGADTTSDLGSGLTVTTDRAVITYGRAVDLAGRDVAPVRAVGGPAVVGRFAGHAPLSRARLTSGFGQRRHPVYGTRGFHSGIDLAAAQGTPVQASSGGRVRRAGHAGGYGVLVTIEHPGGIETRYAHLSAVAVRPGQTVSAGEVIGYVGSTGRSTGPHLHYEVRSGGVAVDPARYWPTR